MNSKQALKRFREFGGVRLLWRYVRMGVFCPAIKALAIGLLREHSVKAVYARLIRAVEQRLVEQYEPIMLKAKARKKGICARSGVPTILWTCWLQGLEQAPLLVRQCVASQKSCFPGYEHHVLTLDNYEQWVKLSEDVRRKYEQGRIPAALFSDLLRLAVLQKYGGVWMDATVLCTGWVNGRLQKQWMRVMESQMTVFRYFDPGTKTETGISNWFIATAAGNIVVRAVYEMLVAYWRDYDCTVDYYMMHLFLELSQRHIPEIWTEMPCLNSRHALLLGGALGAPYSAEDWNELTAHVCIHKLNYRKVNTAQKHSGCYCEKLLAMDFSGCDGRDNAEYRL